MSDEPASRLVPQVALPSYAYVPGHDWPHPIDPAAGRTDGLQSDEATTRLLAALPRGPGGSRPGLAAALAASPGWLVAMDLFNGGFAWEAHEAWEGFWKALGRTTLEARAVQGLIHLAAACVKIREGRPAGVVSHTRRARQLLGGGAADSFEAAGGMLGLDPVSLAAVVAELEAHRPACWHTSRAPVVRVLDAMLRPAA